ncbi:MAG: AI-2E family transporter [Anaerolineales bacterium]|nr:AI-2E family transporter [Anaerolineales bacterium]
MSKPWSPAARYIALGLIIVVLVAVGVAIREMFAPMIIAGLVAYLLYPVVEFLHVRLHMNHKVASRLVYFVSLALFFAVPGTLLPVLSREVQTVARDLMTTLDHAETLLSSPIELGQFIIHLEGIVPNLRESLSGFMTPLPEDAWRLIESTSKGALWVLVIVVSAYYFITDWGRIRDWIINLAPEDHRLDMRRLYLEIKEVWMGFLRGQLTLMSIVAVVFSLIWSIIGLPGALLLGLLGGIFSLVPDVGPFAAAFLATIVALLEGSTWIPWDNFWFALLVFGSYVVLINLKNIWLRPRIYGHSVHMHEGLVFVIIIAAVVFTGVLGAFVIVPALASAGVVFSYLRRRILGLAPFPPMEERVIKVGSLPKTDLEPDDSVKNDCEGEELE